MFCIQSRIDNLVKMIFIKYSCFSYKSTFHRNNSRHELLHSQARKLIKYNTILGFFITDIKPFDFQYIF